MTKTWFVCSLLALAMVVGCEKDTDTTQDSSTQSDQQVETQDPVQIQTQTPAKAEKKMVKLETSKGDIVIELDEEKAPITVKNFLAYVDSGHFSGTIFHRVIKGFMVQGGGFTADMGQKPTLAQIKNEASNGLKNLRGTLAMARTNVPDSATAQFFINHADNDFLNYTPGNPGYAVFGKVTEGMDIVDAIANVATTVKNGMQDVPAETVTIKSATLITE